MEDRGVNLGRRGRKSGSWRWWRVRQVVLLVVGGVDNVLVLTSHLVEDKVDTGLSSLLDGRGTLLELLTVGVGQGRGRVLLRLAHAVEVHVAKLLGSESEQLLLELLLPLGKVDLGSQELSGNSGIHLAVIVLHRGRSQNLVVEHVVLLLVVLVGSAEAGADGRLGPILVEVPGKAAVLVSTHVVLALVVGRRRRGLGRRRRLGRSAEAGQKVGAAGARRLHLVLGNRGDLGGRRNAEALESSSLAARGKARGRVAEALRLEVVVGHLSKTASVHAHFEVVEGCEQRVRLQQGRWAMHTRKDIEWKVMSRVERVAGDWGKDRVAIT